MVEQTIHRNIGHPWDNHPGWDVMFLAADADAELDEYIVRAAVKFWAVWIRGRRDDTGKPAAVLYKPSGAKKSWEDNPRTYQY